LLLCIVNDILDFKLIEENKFVPKKVHFSLADTLNFITKMFTSQTKMSNSSLKFQIMPYL